MIYIGYVNTLAPSQATPEPTSNPTPPGTIGTYCLWGHNDVFKFVNGLYSYKGQYDGNPYYGK